MSADTLAERARTAQTLSSSTIATDPRQRARYPSSMLRSKRNRPPSSRAAWTLRKAATNSSSVMMWFRLS